MGIVGVVIGLFLALALFIYVWGTLFANAKLFGLVRDQARSWREIPREKRRGAFIRVAIMMICVCGYYALMFAAPFGQRKTFLYFLIIPFLVLAPLGTIWAGVYGYRRGRPSSAKKSSARKVPPTDHTG